MELTTYIAELLIGEGVIIAVTCFVICQIIKTSFDFMPNKFIPLIAGLLGASIALTIPHIYPEHDVVTTAIYGLVLGWASTGGYETIKNLINKEDVKIYEKGEK